MTNDVKKSGLNTQAKCEPVIAFVIPCYNEEAALHVTADVLKKEGTPARELACSS